MNLKERKLKLENSVVEVVTSMLPKDEVNKIDAKASYDIEEGNINVLISQSYPHATIKDALAKVVVYTCSYNEEKEKITITSFVRNYDYDAFGISAVNNTPVSLSEDFMLGIKSGILEGVRRTEDKVEAAPDSTEADSKTE